MADFWAQQKAETETMLAEVRAAISAVSKSQNYRIGDIYYTRADLASLRILEQKLLSRLAKMAGGERAVSYGDMSNV